MTHSKFPKTHRLPLHIAPFLLASHLMISCGTEEDPIKASSNANETSEDSSTVSGSADAAAVNEYAFVKKWYVEVERKIDITDGGSWDGSLDGGMDLKTKEWYDHPHFGRIHLEADYISRGSFNNDQTLTLPKYKSVANIGPKKSFTAHMALRDYDYWSGDDVISDDVSASFNVPLSGSLTQSKVITIFNKDAPDGNKSSSGYVKITFTVTWKPERIITISKDYSTNSLLSLNNGSVKMSDGSISVENQFSMMGDAIKTIGGTYLCANWSSSVIIPYHQHNADCKWRIEQGQSNNKYIVNTWWEKRGSKKYLRILNNQVILSDVPTNWYFDRW